MKKMLPIPLSLLLIACGTRSPQPDDIAASDVCTQCKMAISENRYAAELVDAEGVLVKFDSMECLLRYATAHNLQNRASAWFVMDYSGREWLDARQSFFVKSASIPGPMGNGIIAARDEKQAEELARQFSGQPLRFDQLWER